MRSDKSSCRFPAGAGSAPSGTKPEPPPNTANQRNMQHLKPRIVWASALALAFTLAWLQRLPSVLQRAERHWPHHLRPGGEVGHGGDARTLQIGGDHRCHAGRPGDDQALVAGCPRSKLQNPRHHGSDRTRQRLQLGDHPGRLRNTRRRRCHLAHARYLKSHRAGLFARQANPLSPNTQHGKGRAATTGPAERRRASPGHVNHAAAGRATYRSEFACSRGWAAPILVS